MKITKIINKRFFDDPLVKKTFFRWSVGQKNVFSIIRWPKKRFFDDPLAKKTFFRWSVGQKMFFEWPLFAKMFFGQLFEKSLSIDQKSMEKHPKESSQQKSSSKRPSKVPLKIDSTLTTTQMRAALLARRPVFGRRACAPRCCFEICIVFFGLCLAFWLAGFFAGLCFGMAFPMDFFGRQKKQFSKSGTKKHVFKQRSKQKL